MTTISKVRYSRRSMLKASGGEVEAATHTATMGRGQEQKNKTNQQNSKGV